MSGRPKPAESRIVERPVQLPSRGRIYVAVAILLLLNPFIFGRLLFSFAYPDFIGGGTSMDPTLNVGDRLVQVPHLYAVAAPRRGDLVTFPVPPSVDTTFTRYTKRIVALPGERVSVRNDRVFINGQVLDEPYVTRPWNQRTPIEDVRIPAGHYFVMGDNRNASGDSREFGAIPKTDLTRTFDEQSDDIGGIPAWTVTYLEGWLLWLWPITCCVLLAWNLHSAVHNPLLTIAGLIAGFLLSGIAVALLLLWPRTVAGPGVNEAAY